MKTNPLRWQDALLTAVILGTAFLLCLAVNQLLGAQTMTPMIFVLGVFLISVRTQGFFWGITASLLSVLAVNYAFTYPYWAIDLITPECLGSAVVMLVVACVTGALTTQLKRQERIRAEIDKERMRANLLRAVSHDLRTPLTSIYGASSAMSEHFDTLTRDQQLQLLGEMQQDAQWLIRMVENLLSVTRIGVEKVQVQKIPTVLDELLDAVLIKFQKRCPGQEVQVTIPEDFVSIPMDPMLMEQVLINLLENAVHHAHGMTCLRLEVCISGGSARFTVADNGCGIPPERLKNLFTGYLDRHTQPVDGGRSNMGIGLSVCASIIKAHGGEIQAKNHPEGGAVFTFALEMEEASHEQV